MTEQQHNTSPPSRGTAGIEQLLGDVERGRWSEGAPAAPRSARRGRLFSILGVASIVFWLASMVAVYLTTRGLTAEHSLTISPEELAEGFREGQEWHTISMGEEKVGYLHLIQSREGDRYRMRTETVIAMSVLGQEREIRSVLDATLSPEFVLESFHYELESGPTTNEAHARVEGSQVEITLDTGGHTQSSVIDLGRPPVLPFSVKPLFLKHIRNPGDTVSMQVFDPTSFQEVEVVVEYIGRERLTIVGEDVEAIHLRQHLQGYTLDSWVNELGEVYREEMPMGLVTRRVTEEEAKWGVTEFTRSGPPPNVTAATAVNIDSEAALNLTLQPRATYHFTGIDPSGLDIEGFRQSLQIGTEGFLIHVIREPLSVAVSSREGSDPVEVTSRRGRLTRWIPLSVVGRAAPGDREKSQLLEELLHPEPFIESDDPHIIAAARRLVGFDPPATLATLRTLTHFVERHVTNDVIVGVPSAAAVLESGRGDCNEHAVLLTALLRASGIPARMATGLVLMDGKLLYHAWVEAWLGRWVSVDPTQGEIAVDVSHIRLHYGGPSNQVELYRVIGALRLEGIETSPDEQ